MPDVKKAIMAMECCAVGAECDHCPYSMMNHTGYEGCYQMHIDALALLKAQEQKCRECGEVTSKAIQELQTKLKAQKAESVDAPKPDSDIGCWYDITHKYTLEQVVSALKAHGPRVMTLDELSEKTDVYFESLVYDTIAPALSNGSYDDGTVGLMTLEDELFYMDEADYGINWRCWTSRPTDEQREATPWQGCLTAMYTSS